MIVTVTMEVDITAHQKFLHHQMIMVSLFVSNKKLLLLIRANSYLQFSQVTLILKKESRLHTNIEAKDPTRLLCCHRR